MKTSELRQIIREEIKKSLNSEGKQITKASYDKDSN
jgi:hypothetical protein